MFTTLPYLYRDASNYKEGATIVLEGALTEADAAAITATLDGSEFFIPFDLQLGIDELQSRMTSYPSDDDHIWHTLELADREVTETVPEGTSTIAATDFVNAFAAVKARGGWDVANAAERLGV